MKFYQLPPPCNRSEDLRLLFFFTLVLFLTPFLLKSQVPEPEDFAWRESFKQTTKTEFVYNPGLLSQISNKAMFFVMIRPREEQKSSELSIMKTVIESINNLIV